MISPPTDNLYKFVAISGLVLLVLSCSWWWWAGNRVEESLMRGQQSLARTQAQVDRAEAKQSATSDQLAGMHRESDDGKAELIASRFYLGQAKTIFRLGAIGSSLGFALFVWGILMWYQKEQKYQDIIIAGKAAEFLAKTEKPVDIAEDTPPSDEPPPPAFQTP